MQVIGLHSSETQRRSAIGVEVARYMPGDATAFQMAAEVMFDVDMLSRAQVVVGTLASQVTRVGCSIGYARRKLLKAIALDFELLQSQKDLHKQWGVRVDDVPWSPPAC
ncbi:PDE9A [Symbiodinium pilosum]|uniref:PDE9A protein n=1 Tax=Symbiodinium pilosum TaxID=2952 RepID=A0A812V9P3_SYMPI|nr:PDE9A [Symbiodinium pilosum]